MAVQSVRGHFKRIDGIVHAAGVLADKRIAEKTDAQFNSVFDTKVGGLFNLLEATRDDDLKVLCFFGSVAGRVGNPGQVNYAMANETLESVAQFEAQKRPGAAVRVLHWGPWDGGMVTPSLRAVFLNAGSPSSVADGARLFVERRRRPEGSRFRGGRGPTRHLGSARPRRRTKSGGRSGCLLDHGSPPRLPRGEGRSRLPRRARPRGFRPHRAQHPPDLRLSAIKNLRVLKGIRIENFEGQGARLEISCEQASNGSGAQLNCELRSPGGPAHYQPPRR